MFNKFFGKKENSQPPIPDSPQGFGYKNKWLALRSEDNRIVADFLKLKKLRESNWEEGIKFGYEKGIFLTPSIDGWVLVLGIDISDCDSAETKDLLTRLSLRFGECQLFYTLRTVDYYFWVLAKRGKIIRSYSFAEEGNLEILGEATEVEKQFNLPDTFSKESKEEDYWEREDLDLPDNGMVMTIAEAWSINPSTLSERNDLKGLGLVGI